MSSQELIKLENNLLIRQSNAITGSAHGMSATEQNVMYMLISQLRDDDPEDKVYSIRVSDLDKLTNSQVNYSHLQEASKKLIGKVYRVRIENESISFAPLNSFLYEKGSGNILLQLSDKIRPFFFALKNNYTLFQFQTALKLKSKYSKRIYEALCQFKRTGVLKISVKLLKERFELFDPKTGREEYSNFNLFATKVLDVAKKEINEHTDISFEYLTKKTGRKITDLEFKITAKEVVRELAESTLVEPEAGKLKERLVAQFKLSKTLAKKVIENIPIEKIEARNKNTWEDYEAGKIDDLGAYCTTLFQNWLDGAEPILEKPNSPKHIVFKPVQQRTQDPEIEKENLIRLYGFELKQKNVYDLNVTYSSERLKLAISKVDEALRKQEISHDPEQIYQVLIQGLNTQVKDLNFSTTVPSGSTISIGEQLAQIMASSRPAQVKKPLSEEEKKIKEDRDWVWRKLYNYFRIGYLEVDFLMKEHPLEDLKAAIIKVSEEFKDQENPQESGQMIQMLKKLLNLA